MLGALAGGMAIYWGLAAMAKQSGWAPAAFPWRLRSCRRWGAPNGCAVISSRVSVGRTGADRGRHGPLAQAASLHGHAGPHRAHRPLGGAPHALLSDGPRATCDRCCRDWPAAARSVGWGRLRLASAAARDGGRRGFRIVQPNVPQQQKWREDNARAIFDDLQRASTMPTDDQPEGIWRRHPSGLARMGSAVPDRREPGGQGRASAASGRRHRRSSPARSARGPEGAVAETADVFNSIIVFDGYCRTHCPLRQVAAGAGGEFLPLGWLLEPLGFRKVVRRREASPAGQGPVSAACSRRPHGGAARLL